LRATREVAVVHLRRVVDAILTDDTRLAGELLDQVQPESPDNTVATVANCIGIALGLLDDWLGMPSGASGYGAHIAYPPDIGTANAPRPTCSPLPERESVPVAGQTPRPTRRTTSPRRVRPRARRSRHHTP